MRVEGADMPAFVLSLVTALAFAGYFVPFVVFRRPFYRRVAWEFLAVISGATALALVQATRAPAFATAIAAALCAGVLAFAAWFFVSFSMYHPREDRPAVGDRFPDFTLPTSEGGTFSLAGAYGRRLLVLCYRGDW